MNVILIAINAKYIHSNLAVYNLKACAGEFRQHIRLAEYTINERTEVIIRDVCSQKPDFIAVSCYIWNIRYVEEICSDVNKIYTDVPIWVGGPEVSYEGERFLAQHPFITGVMYGEGEATFRKVLNHYFKESLELDNIDGIIYRNENKNIVKNKPAKLLDMDSIPFVYNNIEKFKNKIIYYESSRGCPFSCSYCLSSIDKTVRYRSISLVKEELMYFIEHNVPQVKFVDRTFNCDKIRARNIWKFIAENDNGMTNFHFEVGADLLEDEDFNIFDKMRDGLIQLEIGVQSTNKETLEHIRRFADIEKIKYAAERINKEKNIHQHLDLIAGLPYESYQSFKQSFADVFAMSPNQLQLGFLKVLKGSYMCEKAKEYGIKYSSFPPYEVLYTNWISFDEIIKLKSVEEMVEVYYNSQQFAHSLDKILVYYDNPFDFFDKLADFYENKGYSRKSHNRIARYNILREFIIDNFPQESDRICEYMILDLYARENLKSRPDWACDLKKYKDIIYSFYKSEEAAPFYLKEYEGYNFKQLIKMTHLEIFNFIDGEQSAYLFDYRRRNPVNKEALIIKICMEGTNDKYICSIGYRDNGNESCE